MSTISLWELMKTLKFSCMNVVVWWSSYRLYWTGNNFFTASVISNQQAKNLFIHHHKKQPDPWIMSLASVVALTVYNLFWRKVPLSVNNIIVIIIAGITVPYQLLPIFWQVDNIFASLAIICSASLSRADLRKHTQVPDTVMHALRIRGKTFVNHSSKF